MDFVANRVRSRIAGLLVEGEKLLLVKLEPPTRNYPVWMPPGGEVEVGETMSKALKREVDEETGLQVETGRLAYVHEFIHLPYHVIEHYFVCRRRGGTLEQGSDPELGRDSQIILDVRFIPLTQLPELELEPAFLREQLAEDLEMDVRHPQWITSTVE